MSKHIKMKKGFTLIELLVVVVIIGILSGIGISQFKGQQQKAVEAKRTAECSQYERCELLIQTCVAGGESFADCQICDTSSLACRLNYVDGGAASGVGEFWNLSSGTIAGEKGIISGSGFTRLGSNDLVIPDGKDGYLEFSVPASGLTGEFSLGMRTTPASHVMTWGVYFGQGAARASAVPYGPGYQPFQADKIFRIERSNGKIFTSYDGEKITNDATYNGPMYLAFYWRNGRQINDLKVVYFD